MDSGKQIEFIKIAQDKSTAEKLNDLKKLVDPTTSGIISAIGLGTLSSALASLYRKRQKAKGKEVTFASNPILAGLLGAAGGYLGGNKLNDLLTEKPSWPVHSDDSVPGMPGSRVGSPTALASIPALVNGAKTRAQRKAIEIAHHAQFNASRLEQNTLSRIQRTENSIHDIIRQRGIQNALPRNLRIGGKQSENIQGISDVLRNSRDAAVRAAGVRIQRRLNHLQRYREILERRRLNTQEAAKALTDTIARGSGIITPAITETGKKILGREPSSAVPRRLVGRTPVPATAAERASLDRAIRQGGGRANRLLWLLPFATAVSEFADAEKIDMSKVD